MNGCCLASLCVGRPIIASAAGSLPRHRRSINSRARPAVNEVITHARNMTMALIQQPFETIDSYISPSSAGAARSQAHGRELQAMREQEDSINGAAVAALVLSIH